MLTFKQIQEIVSKRYGPNEGEREKKELSKALFEGKATGGCLEEGPFETVDSLNSFLDELKSIA